MATSTFSTGIPRVDSTGDDPLVPRLIFAQLEDASLHPECSFAIPSVAIFAPVWLQVPKVLKDQDSSPVLLGKLDNANAHEMRDVLVCIVDLAPEVYVVLFPFGYDTGLASIASNPP